MAVLGGVYLARALMNATCTNWVIGLVVSTSDSGGQSRIDFDVELQVPVSNSENQTRTAIINKGKDYITNTWGVTFQPSDTVQVYGCSLFEG